MLNISLLIRYNGAQARLCEHRIDAERDRCAPGGGDRRSALPSDDTL